ncbi:MAG: T9SS type A sorting domain-containing protein [bacterium]
MKSKIGFCLIIVLLCVVDVYAHDVGTHWYIGLQTMDVWQEYDPDFYYYLNHPNETIRVITRKFYCVGLALPDILDQQNGIRSFMNKLYEYRNEIVYPEPGSGFYIEDHTKNAIQTAIEFNGENPNANLAKLKEMADWARVNISDVEDRAVVYGALMHVIHDLYAHMAQQPSRFGYGKVYHKCYIPPIGWVVPEEEPIYLGEPYYEIFTPTYIPNWDFVINEIYRGFWTTGGVVGGKAACAELWRTYNILGQVVNGFQDFNFNQIKGFKDAADAVGYSTSSLTQERLEAYIHGGFVAFFLLYGYEKGGENLGGIAAHPNWRFIDIAEFIKNIGEANFRIRYTGPLHELVVEPISVEFAVNFVYKIIRLFPSFFRQRINIGPWLDVMIDEISNNPWYTYLESVEGVDSLWAAIPPEQQSEYEDEYITLRGTIGQWNQGDVTKPNLRSSYSNEISEAVAIKDFYRQSLLQGSSYFDYYMNDIYMYVVMRKQGPLGGFFDVEDNTYFRQPAILNMYFNHVNNAVWAEIEIPISSPIIDLYYDFFKFGRSRIQIWGKGIDGNPPSNSLNETHFYGSSDKHTGYFSFNAVEATNSGYRETSFRGETWSSSHARYWRMFDSDYRTGVGPVRFSYPYNAWFNWGDPTRQIDQDPITDPLHYWPYVLEIVPLKRPTGLRFEEMFPASSVKVLWIDNSDLEDGFKIARKKDNEQWNEDYDELVGQSPGSGSTVEYIDTVTIAHKYSYKITAYDNNGRSSDWSDINIYVHGSIAQSGFSKMSAFNNSIKVVMSGSNVYIVYVTDQDWAPDGKPHIVYCSRSTDGGNSFVEDELESHGYIADYPSIVLDNDAKPHVVWGAITKIGGKYYRKYFYSTYDGYNWTAPQPIYGNYLSITGELTIEHLCPPSFVIKGDSGFVTWQENYDAGGNYNGLDLTTFELSNPTSTSSTHGIKHGVCFAGLRAPSIGYDPGGRLVLAYATWWDQACAYGDINFIYRETNGIWSNPVLIGNEQAVTGIPSLCTQYARVYVGFQHLLNDDSIAYATLNWQGSSYTSPVISFIAQLDPPGQWPFSAFPNLVNENLVTWQNNDGDIYYSQKAGATWTTPENISNTADEVSSYPQGVVFGSSSQRRLLCLWTQQIGDDYYLVRDKIDLPSVCPYIDVAQSDVPEATGYNNSQRLLRDANNVLHLAFTSNDNVYHTFLQDIAWSEPIIVGAGKYPSLLSGSDNMLYSIYAYNEGSNSFLEELRLNILNDQNWSAAVSLMHTYDSYLWGVGAPSYARGDTMGYFIFETSYGPTYHPEPGAGSLPPIITLRGIALVYGKFSLSSPAECQWQILDSVPLHSVPVSYDTIQYTDSIVESLISPSITVDPEGIVHIIWEGVSDSIYYYRIQDTVITKQISPGVMIDHPLIAMREDQVDHFWCEQNQIKHQYTWTGTASFSGIETIAECENPYASGPYLTWTKQNGMSSHLYIGAIPASKMVEPVEIEHTTESIVYPQILYNPVKNDEPASLDLIWNKYNNADNTGHICYINIPIVEPVPIYAFNMGTEIPVPITVQRQGYLALGSEDFQTFDYDSTELIYHIALHSSAEKYRIRWTYYHEESNKLKLEFSIDDILHHNTLIDSSEKIIQEAWIPQACLNDKEITIKVKRLNGSFAILSGLEIEMHEAGGGGPQSAEVRPIKHFFFENIHPNPTRGLLKIRFNSPDERKVTVKMYDVVGRVAETIFNGNAKIGMNECIIVPKDLAAGVYFIRLETEDYTKTEKVILLK